MNLRTLIQLAVACFVASLHAAEPDRLPLKGGENVLFIGNSLTGGLGEDLAPMIEANGLPAINAYRVQLWYETLRTHVLLSPEKTPGKFTDQDPKSTPQLKKLGFKLSGNNSLFGKGIYAKPELSGRGYVTALEAIKLGTPEGKPWDVIVVQAYTDAEDATNKITTGADGKLVYEGPLMEYGSILIDAIRAAGAQPVVYAAWGPNPNLWGGMKGKLPDVYQRGITNYKALGEAKKVPVIPVRSAAWTLIKDRQPAGVPIDWLQRDNVHGSTCGRALLQFIVTSALYGKPATDLKYPPTAKKKNGDDEDFAFVLGKKDAKHDFLITSEIDTLIKQTAQDTLKNYGWSTQP